MPHAHDDPLRNLSVLRQKLDARAGQLYSRFPRQFACRAGCDGCCQTERTVNDVEYAALERAHAALPAATRERLRAQATPGGSCSLLLDGRCAIYADRPLICRSHGLPILMEGRRDVCPLNFEGVGLDALAPEDLISVHTLTAILVAVDALYCQETGGSPGRRRPVSALSRGGDTGPHTENAP